MNNKTLFEDSSKKQGIPCNSFAGNGTTIHFFIDTKHTLKIIKAWTNCLISTVKIAGKEFYIHNVELLLLEERVLSIDLIPVEEETEDKVISKRKVGFDFFSSKGNKFQKLVVFVYANKIKLKDVLALPVRLDVDSFETNTITGTQIHPALDQEALVAKQV